MSDQSIKVSVIVPCFNQGQYIDETIESVLAQTYQNFEIIVVNDGSTDPATIEHLQGYDRPKTKVFHIANQGLAGARNYGILNARGKYILPLDSDDKIADSYLEQAIEILDANSEIGIVYCEAEFFGDRIGKWELPKYQFPDILLGNAIFCSGFYRRSDWEKAGGYSRIMTYGWEDYDFWLSLLELGRQVYCIPETLFFYRQTESSMTKKMQVEHYIYSYAQIYRNHPQLYSENIEAVFKRFVTLEASLDQARVKLEQAQHQLGQTQQELGQTQQQLGQTQQELGQTQHQLGQTQHQLGQTQQELNRSRAQIEAMQTSKFWKLRAAWFQVKRTIGLPVEDD